MADHLTYILIHSPLVGPLTWKLVAQTMAERGLKAVAPTLADSDTSILPFWQQHAESVAQQITSIPRQDRLVLVAHSGAGPILPAIRELLPHPIAAYLFVDAGIPHDGRSRLELMREEDAVWAERFYKSLARGRRYPTWTADDLRSILPDDRLREALVGELHPRALPFFSEPLPVFQGWPDAPCAYLKFSPAYNAAAAQARAAGWPTRELPGGHFHMLVDPDAVARELESLAETAAR